MCALYINLIRHFDNIFYYLSIPNCHINIGMSIRLSLDVSFCIRQFLQQELCLWNVKCIEFTSLSHFVYRTIVLLNASSQFSKSYLRNWLFYRISTAEITMLRYGTISTQNNENCWFWGPLCQKYLLIYSLTELFN